MFVVRQVAEKRLRQREGAERLEVCLRQMKRLVQRWRCHGDAGLVSRRRGCPSPNRMGVDKRKEIVAILQGKYPDFGATLACEKWAALEGITVSVETVQPIQIASDLWKPKKRRPKRVFQVRQRRPRYGELVQIDGSPHDWFEGRAPRCNLVVLVKEMRLQDRASIEAANAFVPTFIGLWNAKFAVPPRDKTDAHRPWRRSSDTLDDHLAQREQRTLSKALTFRYGGTMYCVKTDGPGTALRGAKVTLFLLLNGTMRVQYEDRILSVTAFKTFPVPSPTEDEKTIDARVEATIANQPPAPVARPTWIASRP